MVCGWGIFNLIGFFCEIFWPSPEWPQALYSPFLRRMIMGFFVLGFVGAVIVTALTELSKFHLVWFIPVWYLFGIHRWIEWVWLSYSPNLIGLIYPEFGLPWFAKLAHPSLVPSILRRKYQARKKELSARAWDRFPVEFVKGLRETLGSEKFDSLTLLAEKYRLFDQELFAHPEFFTDIGNEITRIEVAGLLTSMGNELSRRHIVEDAEKVFRIALALRPEDFAARGMLAVICNSSGRLCEAREHAVRAMADMDSLRERFKDIDVPAHIADPDAVGHFRLLLQSISQGKVSD